MSKIWIVVSDSSRARFFSSAKASVSMVEFKDFVHPEARQHSRDITSDLPGKQQDSVASGHHSLEPRTDAQEQAGIDFANELATYLSESLMARKFSSLVIIAAPSFLGELRKKLDQKVKKVVSLEIDKNLVKQSEEGILSHLPKFLPG